MGPPPATRLGEEGEEEAGLQACLGVVEGAGLQVCPGVVVEGVELQACQGAGVVVVEGAGLLVYLGAAVVEEEAGLLPSLGEVGEGEEEEGEGDQQRRTVLFSCSAPPVVHCEASLFHSEPSSPPASEESPLAPPAIPAPPGTTR